MYEYLLPYQKYVQQYSRRKLFSGEFSIKRKINLPHIWRKFEVMDVVDDIFQLLHSLVRKIEISSESIVR
jgi:hypothetical protein